MGNFNNEFDNNRLNSNSSDNESTNSENRESDNTPVCGETGKNEGEVRTTEQERDPVRNEPAEAKQTSSYSYTGDRLTENKTEVGHTPASNQNENRHTVYNMPHMNGNGGISYSPDPSEDNHKKKKKEKTVTFTRTGAIVLCCAAVCLSAATGFIGAYAANSLVNTNPPAVTAPENTNDQSNVGGVDDPVAIFYRSVSTTGIGSSENGNLTYREVTSLVQDSVVEIVTEFNTTSLWFQYVTSGAGSGVIMSEDGYVITNNHVIRDEESGNLSDSVTVRLRNGEEYKAEIIGADPDSDIALLKIDAAGLTPAVSGNSDSLAVGEEVLAVGNPLGELGGTVTNGIVSATDREIVVGDVTMNLIQTNAAVNPGNSGGGLFNMNGELIGIVNAKSSGSDVEGLGFAIPINDALSVAEQLLEYGYVRGKVMIGVQFLDATDSSIARKYGLKPGLYVYSLEKGYNDKNLKPGDRVIAINGNEVSAYEDITAIVKASSIGDILTFQIYRDGKLTEAQVEVFEKIPDEVGGEDVQFETENPADDTFSPEEDADVFVSPYPDDNSSAYNPFEGTPFEDFFNAWGFGG